MYKQDGYKVTMAYAEQAVFGAGHQAEWEFRSRGPEKLGVLVPALRQRLPRTTWAWDCDVDSVGAPELDIGRRTPYLRGLGLSYEFLQYFRAVCVGTTVPWCTLEIRATPANDLVVRASGASLAAGLWEIPVLGHTADAWTMHNHAEDLEDLYAEGDCRLTKKIQRYNAIPAGVCLFGDMGTRRALTFNWGMRVTRRLSQELRHYAGTSNLGMACELDVPCLRTMAHQWLQMGQVLSPDLANTQGLMLRAWADVYRGTSTPLIALTDCLGLDVFLREFTYSLAVIYDGVRHDSGDPIAWGNRILAHYSDLGIDPRTKIVVFSDGLCPEEVFRILDAFAGKFKLIIFGIGTDFTNDCGVVPLKIVMKLVRYDGKPVAKLPDTRGKTMCDDSDFVARLKRANNIK